MKIKLTLALVIFTSICAIAQINNACEPTQPRIMVFPSDNMLYQLKCIKEIKSDTLLSYYVRQYEKAFMEKTDLKFVIAGINGKFADRGYPLESLEESAATFLFRNGKYQAHSLPSVLFYCPISKLLYMFA